MLKTKQDTANEKKTTSENDRSLLLFLLPFNAAVDSRLRLKFLCFVGYEKKNILFVCNAYLLTTINFLFEGVFATDLDMVLLT